METLDKIGQLRLSELISIDGTGVYLTITRHLTKATKGKKYYVNWSAHHVVF